MGLNPNLSNADIIFISDGGASLSDDVISRVKEHQKEGLRIFVLLMGCSLPNNIRDITEAVIDIELLASNDDADDAIAQIFKQAKER